MISPEILLLCGTAAVIAFVHTLLGPDHYLPFVVLAKSRGWTQAKTLRTTLWCGSGHIPGSVVLGFIGIYASMQLHALEWVEGLRRAWRNRPHTHWHSHGGERHAHVHTHRAAHAHVHSAENTDNNRRSRASWAIFIVFILGPSEPLIPILMFPAARVSPVGLAAVAVSLWGLQSIRLPGMERFSEAIARGTISLCGLSMAVLGL